MQLHKFLTFKSCGFFSPCERIFHSHSVVLNKVVESPTWLMANVANPVYCNECSCQIGFPSIVNYEGIATQDSVPVFYGLKSIVYIAHVPMNECKAMPRFNKIEVFIEHMFFKLVIASINFF